MLDRSPCRSAPERSGEVSQRSRLAPSQSSQSAPPLEFWTSDRAPTPRRSKERPASSTLPADRKASPRPCSLSRSSSRHSSGTRSVTPFLGIVVMLSLGAADHNFRCWCPLFEGSPGRALGCGSCSLRSRTATLGHTHDCAPNTDTERPSAARIAAAPNDFLFVVKCQFFSCVKAWERARSVGRRAVVGFSSGSG